MFQDYLLFPNLTALENVAFGLRARGIAKGEARASAPRPGSSGSGSPTTPHHRPRALSGGQAQRVALARALATEPRLLLLDEPLAALDAGTRGDVRRDLRRHLATFDGVRLLVTHDPVDAYALADRVVILEAGRGRADRHARRRHRPAPVPLRRRPRRRQPARRHRPTTAPSPPPPAARIVPADPVDGPAFAVIQPHAVALYPSPPDGSPRNVWPATVADVDRQADRVRVRLDGDVPLVAEITPAALDDLALQPGDRIWATVKATEITTYPA